MSAVPRSPKEAQDLLQSLQDTVSDIKARMEAFSRWKDATNARVETLEDENDELRDRLEALEARLDVIEDNGERGKDAKVRELVAYAENIRSPDQPAVILAAKEIKGATGVSRRYAYDLIDDLPGQYHFIITRREARQRQFANVEIDDSKQSKAIAIDCEALHNDSESVNKFTTTREGEGGRR